VGILVTAADDRGLGLDTGSPPFHCCDEGTYPKQNAAAPQAILFLLASFASRRFRHKLGKSLGFLPKGVTMRRSGDRILTTHTGSLSRPPELTRLYVRRARGESVNVVDDSLTNFTKHPEAVADRLERVAAVIGDPRRVIGGANCGVRHLGPNGPGRRGRRLGQAQVTRGRRPHRLCAARNGMTCTR
jgi:hypothetical protein